MSRRRLSEPSFAFLLNAPALLAIVGLVGYSAKKAVDLKKQWS